MSGLLKEHIEAIRQYLLSDNERIKQKIRSTVPAMLLKNILIIQDGFDRNLDTKVIASQIEATEFEKKIEQLQAEYYLKYSKTINSEFEQELASAIKQTERESIKKKLIAFDASLNDEISDAEIASAIKAVERESLKEKFRQFDREEDVMTAASYVPPDSGEEIKVAAKRAISRFRIPVFARYAAAACVLLAVGYWYFNFRQKPQSQNNLIAHKEQKSDSTNKGLNDISGKPVLIAEVTTDTSISYVLTSGLGFGEVTENITIIEHNQHARIASLEKEIRGKKELLRDEERKGETASDTVTMRMIDQAISELQKELSDLNQREQHYLFNGHQLSLFTSVPFVQKSIILYNDIYYLNTDNAVFHLKVSSKPEPLRKETNTEILRALDKIMYNAN